jgi:hypothetical protein
MILRKAALAVLLGAGSLAGCGPSTQAVRLAVAGNVPDASVTIDDIFLGSLAYVQRHGIAVPPGKHRITVEKVGYFPWDRLVEATDQPIVLDVKLEPIPD